MPWQEWKAALTLQAYCLHQRRCSTQLTGAALGQSERLFAFLQGHPALRRRSVMWLIAFGQQGAINDSLCWKRRGSGDTAALDSHNTFVRINVSVLWPFVFGADALLRFRGCVAFEQRVSAEQGSCPARCGEAVRTQCWQACVWRTQPCFSPEQLLRSHVKTYSNESRAGPQSLRLWKIAYNTIFHENDPEMLPRVINWTCSPHRSASASYIKRSCGVQTMWNQLYIYMEHMWIRCFVVTPGPNTLAEVIFMQVVGYHRLTSTSIAAVQFTKWTFQLFSLNIK